MNEFERKAWENRTSADQHPPKRALEAAIDKIERGELKNIKHVIVIAIEDVNGGDCVHSMQAGTLSELAAEGAMNRAIAISRESVVY